MRNCAIIHPLHLELETAPSIDKENIGEFPKVNYQTLVLSVVLMMALP
jgi:hypothetical protein